MHGEINVAAIMAEKQHPPTTPTIIDPHLVSSWEQERQRRLHVDRLLRAWQAWGATQGDEEAQAKVRQEWGEILVEALERRKAYRKWLKKEHMPRVAKLNARAELVH